MSFWDSFKSSWQSIVSTKMRSVLTVLGVVIGVAAVVFLVGLGRGQEDAIISRFEDMGANAFYVSITYDKAGSGGSLSLDDAEALEDSQRAPSVAVVAPSINTQAKVAFGNADVNVTCKGITPDLAEVQRYPVEKGSFISDNDVNRRTSVAVLGFQTAIDLFGESNPIGETLRVEGRRFQVIGVIEELGGRPGSDDYVLIPLTTMQSKIVSGKDVQQIAVLATNTDKIDAAIAEVTAILMERHHIREGEDPDFDIRNMTELLERMTESLATFSIFLAAVGAIALVVGGIGIMNIMLVSVTERTREIGIRKAIGATRTDVLSQFLTEAAMLSFTGGIIGLLIAIAGTELIGGLSMMGPWTVEAQITPDIVIIALCVAIGVGLISGTYPAFRAAMLDPIDSLRHE
jgi:putative ABC transport system permease protein